MQYTARLSAVRTRESKRRGHYIAFRQIEGVWYRFDDAVVHSVVLQPSYNINIVIYKRGDQPDYHSPVDLSNVPRLCRSVILNRSNQKSASQQPAEEVGQELQRPPLITPDKNTPSTSAQGIALTAEHPTRRQPKRGQKDYIVYYADDSQSSDEENIVDKTHSDSDYTPTKQRGTCCSCKFLANIHTKCQCSEIN